MRKMILGISAVLLLAGTAISEEITYSVGSSIVNSGYTKKASLSVMYRGEYWIKFQELQNRLIFNLNLNVHKFVSIQPFGLQMNLERRLDPDGDFGFTKNNVAFRPSLNIHVPLSKFFVGGQVYLHNEFNLKIKRENGTESNPSQVYRPFFGAYAFIAKDLGMVQPLVGYNYDGHIEIQNNRARYWTKHYIFAGLNIKLLDNLLILSPDYRLRIFPDATAYKVENIVGFNLGLNIH